MRILIALFCCAMAASAACAEELKGHVQSKGAQRVQRPLTGVVKRGAALPESPGTASHNAPGGIAVEQFQLPGKTDAGGASLSGSSSQTQVNAGTTSSAGSGSAETVRVDPPPPVLPVAPLPPLFPSGTSTSGAPPVHPGSGGQGGSPPARYDFTPTRSDKLVTVRVRCYNSQNNWESVWEAFHMANLMLKKCSNVTILLDIEAVNAANRHDMKEYQLHRQSTEKMIPMQRLLREFIDAGGKVYASERWAKFWGVAGGSYPSLTPGVELLPDEEMADKYIESAGSIIDY